MWRVFYGIRVALGLRTKGVGESRREKRGTGTRQQPNVKDILGIGLTVP